MTPVRLESAAPRSRVKHLDEGKKIIVKYKRRVWLDGRVCIFYAIPIFLYQYGSCVSTSVFLVTIYTIAIQLIPALRASALTNILDISLHGFAKSKVSLMIANYINYLKEFTSDSEIFARILF